MNIIVAVIKLSIVIAAVLAVVMTLVTGNAEYFRGMTFAMCLVWSAVAVRDWERRKAKGA